MSLEFSQDFIDWYHAWVCEITDESSSKDEDDREMGWQCWQESANQIQQAYWAGETQAVKDSSHPDFNHPNVAKRVLTITPCPYDNSFTHWWVKGYENRIMSIRYANLLSKK